MKKFLSIFCLVIGTAMMQCCSEKDIDMYREDPRIFIQIPGSGSVALRDSVIFSFPAKPDVGPQDTLWFKAAIMGNTVNYDRPFKLTVNTANTTAVEGVNYKIESRFIPANAYEVLVPVIVFREGLKDKSVRLEFDVQENENFKKGYERYQKAIFIWGDMFLKPDIWDTSNYRNAFGEFTQTRYAFILNACKITELPDPLNLVMLGHYNAVVRKALLDYNNSHSEPLKDENGVVNFYVYTGVGGVG